MLKSLRLNTHTRQAAAVKLLKGELACVICFTKCCGIHFCIFNYWHERVSRYIFTLLPFRWMTEAAKSQLSGAVKLVSKDCLFLLYCLAGDRKWKYLGNIWAVVFQSVCCCVFLFCNSHLWLVLLEFFMFGGIGVACGLTGASAYCGK